MTDIQQLWDKIFTYVAGFLVAFLLSLAPPSEPVQTNTLTPSPTQIPSPTSVQEPIPTDSANAKPWGEAWRQEDGSYTMKIQEDSVMSAPQELAEAINRYRETKGMGRLAWSDTLAAYAQSRAEYIVANGSDRHAGFNNFVENEDGFQKLGFNCLGENMSEGFRLSGTHLVEWMYAQSPGHDANQLNPIYASIGVGIGDRVSVLIFGGCN